MKTAEEFLKEIDASAQLQEEWKAVKGADAADAFLKKHGCGASAKEFAAFVKARQGGGQGELSDDAVSSVSGGRWMDVGAGWIEVDDTPPVRKQKQEPAGPLFPYTFVQIEDE